MTEHYKIRLIWAYELHKALGYDYKQIAGHYGFGKAVNDHISGTFNRFVKINASVQDVRDYLDENYLRSTKTLEYYIRYVGERNRQISARRLAAELGIYDIERLKNCLRGLSILCPDLVSYTDTHGLDNLTIR